MFKSIFSLLILSIGFFTASVPAQNSTPVTAVRSFYKFDRSHSQVFKRSAIDARKKWFSAELYKLFLYELKRENTYLRTHQNEKPYFGDGLPFQPIDETCKAGGKELHRGVEVKPAFQKGRRAAVIAAFAFPKQCSEKDVVTFTIGIVKSGTAWVIDDVNFGEDRTLKQDLKRKDY